MKKVILIIALTLTSMFVKAQGSIELEEDKVVANNGLEYSYVIKNERTEETYSRYEITLMVQNKSGCMIIYFKKDGDDLSTLFEGDPSAIARFECVNATGKRLTSKGGNVKAKPFKVPYNNNGTTVKVEGGYLLKNGSRASSDIIVIVAKGERPKIKVRPQDFAELTD